MSKRAQKTSKTKLRTIPGIGPANAQRLVEQGMGFKEIAECTPQELKKRLNHLSLDTASEIITYCRVQTGSDRENSGMNDIARVELPSEDEVPLEEWTPLQRQAAILKLLKKKGTPDAISVSALARRFKKNPSTLWRDFETVKSYVKATLGEDADVKTQSVYNWALSNAMEQNNVKDTVRVLESWNNWLFDKGVQEKVADKIHVEGGFADEFVKLYEETKGMRDEEEEYV